MMQSYTTAVSYSGNGNGLATEAAIRPSTTSNFLPGLSMGRLVCRELQTTGNKLRQAKSLLKVQFGSHTLSEFGI